MSDNEQSHNSNHNEEENEEVNEEQEVEQNEDVENNEENENNEDNDNENEEQNDENEEEKELENPDNEDYRAMLTVKDSKDYGVYYQVYNWIDSIKFSKPKKNLTRDFSDGVNFVELLHKSFKPSPIEIHTISRTYNKEQKFANWKEIQTKLNKKSIIKISDSEIRDIVDMKPYAIETLLESIFNYVSEGKTIIKEVNKTQLKQNPVKNYMKNIESK